MLNITTPKAIIIGFALVALSITSLPYQSFLVSPAKAEWSMYDLRRIEGSLDGIANAVDGISISCN